MLASTDGETMRSAKLFRFLAPRRAFRVFSAAFVLFAAVAVPAQTADAGVHDLCFAVADAGPNAGADHLVSVVPSTGVSTGVGDTGGTGNIETMAMEPGGNTLYALDGAQFGWIDQATGAFTTIGSGVGGGFTDVDSLTFDPFTGELWAVERNVSVNDTLFQIDVATGAHIPSTVVTINSSGVTGLYDIDDLSVSSFDNTMYGVNNSSGGGDLLVSVDRITGAVVQVMDLAGLGVPDMEGLAYDNAGTLMGTDGQGAPNGDLWEIDIAGNAVNHLADLSPGGDFESLGCLTADLNTITGTTFFDTNGDGSLDAGDVGEGSVTVRLYRDVNGDGLLDGGDIFLTSTDTAGDGTYAFSIASSGDFVLDIDTGDLPAGFNLSTDNLETASFAGYGLTDANNDFGYTLPAMVGNYVWVDADVDGIQDGGESGLAGVTVNLLDAGGSTVATTTTAADGSYLFTGLAPGDYRVEFVTPAGYSFSPADQGGDDAADSDANTGTGQTPLFTLAANDVNGTLDAGMYQPASIGDFVWIDDDADGVQDGGETGLAGVTVNLLDSGGSTIASTTTAGDGSYSFTGLTPGDYRVEFVAPAGHTISAADQGGDDTADSDANPATGQTPLTTLGAGATNPTLDAGMYELASLGDYVWTDTDADGIQDGSETGLGGVTVNLLDSGGSTVGSTTTAGDGSYSFSGLTPGDYRVEFVAPAGHTISPADQGGDDTADSDANPATGQTPLTTLTSGDNDTSLDAGMYVGASIGDYVWTDTDADGIQDASETGLGGVTVNLLDSGGTTIASTTTAGDGSYSFTGLTPGDYRVEFVAPAGHTISPADQGGDDTADSDANPATGQTPLVTLTSGDSNLTLDAGMYQPASIGDFVWTDSDADGIQDGGETGLGGVTVNLLDSGGTTIATTTTAGDGSYSFTGLTPGDYRIEFVAPAGHTISAADQGGDDTADSDANPATGQTPLVTLTSGENDTSLDAGMYQPASIGDYVWTDSDADGIQDGGETGLAGVTVNLLDSGGSTIASTTTAGDGSYSFTGLTPGDYRIEFVEPSGYGISPADQGGDDTADSDANPATGQTPLVTLTSGDNDTSLDAGMYPGAELGDFVWTDSDADGVQDGGETGLSGVTVNLLDSGGTTIASTTTAGDGSYSFTGLTPGDYRVEFVTPAGYTISAADQGGDDTADSDANPATGQTPLVTLGPTAINTTLDAGMYQPASIGDFVWIDTDADGVQDGGETGLAGVTVNLLDSGGTTIATTTTAGDGSYSFTGLTPGDYGIEFVAPAGHTISPADQGGDDTADSDANPATGQTPLTTLTSGENDTSLDTGMYEPAAIGDFVWTDDDADGIQDGGETGLGGVTVNLLDSGGTTIATTTTAGDGSYGFTGLTPGDYRIEFVTPAGYTISAADQGGDDTADSDANPATGQTPLTTLTSGETDTSLDAGLHADASLGDYVWSDADGDGIQDGSETGLAGVTVNLLDSGGTTVATTTTAGDGSYGFTGLTPGDYRIEFVTPAGYTISAADQGGDDTADSDANPATGQTPLVTLTSGENDTSLDAGMYQPASIGDFVWTDSDGDGIQDGSETGLGGVTVNLLDSGGTTIATTTTAGDGSYSFTGLTPGDYRIEFVTPAGYALSAADQGGDDTADSDANPATGQTPLVTLTSGASNLTLDAGMHEPAALGDFVWTDSDADGVQDGSETGLAGVTVNLLDSGGTTIATTTTAGDGSYSFTGLTPGDYRVEFVTPAGYTISAADQGGDDTADSDANPATGQTPLVTLTSGDNDTSLDAAMYADTSIGDYVWIDTDADGIQDGGETGLAGVTVNLLDSGGTTIATTTTAGDGSYSFTGLTPGDYRVEFVAPAGYTISAADQGGDDTADSDANPATGQTPLVTLTSGASNLTLDAGMYELASLGDYVWTDTDANGIQDGSETGLGGVTVNLLDSGGTTIATTTTAGDGSYSFTGLTPGDYRIEFVEPGGYGISPADQGGDDTADSDANPATGQTPLTTLASGENDTSLDAAMYADASIGDYVWIDDDADGIQDASETGIGGVTVNLLDSGGTTIATTTTAGDGSYSFTGLTPGDYTVEFVAPAGHTISPADQGGDDTADSDANPATGQTPLTTLASGENDTSLDAGLYTDASLGDYVWEDTDADGIQDGGETGLAGVTVNLLDSGGTTIATTTTAGDGSYSFTGLTPGSYQIEFVAPAGLVPSPVDAGGDDTTDSDADPLTGRTAIIFLPSGTDRTDIDAGMFAGAMIGDQVWDDTDGDGVHDTGEPGIPGVTVNLYDDGGTLVSTVLTDGTGRYGFPVVPGTYTVEFVPPAGMVHTPADQGGDDTTDSDADPVTGRAAAVTVTSGATITTIDAGMYTPASIGDTVFFDLDEDGIQDPGEPGIGGITVELRDSGGTVVGTTTTDENGRYLFTDLPPDDYEVTAIPPTGLANTTPNPQPHTLASGDAVDTADFGFIGTGQLGQLVWFDTDGDGVRDPGEEGIDGAQVSIVWAGVDGIHGTPDDVTFTTTTDDGAYLFTGLPPGTYRVTVSETSLPSGAGVTHSPDGGTDLVAVLSLALGQSITDANFAITDTEPLAFTGLYADRLVMFAIFLLVGGETLMWAAKTRRA